MKANLSWLGLGAVTAASALQLSVSSTVQTTIAASALAAKLVGYFTDLSTGVLPAPYWWWESASALTTLVHYSHYTGDSQYDQPVANAIKYQAARPPYFASQAGCLGNDDLLWYGILSITAAETGLAGSTSLWLEYAENVFYQVIQRWDTATCNGGLHWQIASDAQGYDYKNAITNGLFFQLAARLGRFTGDNNYIIDASRIWDWSVFVGLIDPSTYSVYDGVTSTQDCSSPNHDQWSYNAGVFLYGAAVMLDVTGDKITWQPRLNGLISSVGNSFTNGTILQERICEPTGNCDTDQLSFKGYVSRWFSATMALVPSTVAQIQPILLASLAGALASCNDDSVSDQCGFRWTLDGYDGTEGVGQQLSALELVHGQLATSRPLPQKATWVTRRTSRAFAA